MLACPSNGHKAGTKATQKGMKKDFRHERISVPAQIVAARHNQERQHVSLVHAEHLY